MICHQINILQFLRYQFFSKEKPTQIITIIFSAFRRTAWHKHIFIRIHSQFLINRESMYQAKTIDISSNNIGLPSTKNRNVSSSIHHENRYFKKQNEALKKQLETISLRLDGQLKKRVGSKKRRPWSKGPEEVTYMQLQNAYKKCQIYKKEVNFYRKKLSSIEDESKCETYETKMNEYMKENIELKSEIKSLNKLIKIQEKGLVEMGTQEYTKLYRDIERLKEENRRLKKSLAEYRVSSLNIKESNVKFEENSSARKLKTEDDGSGDEPLRDKLQKSYIKVKLMNKESNHLRDLLDNYKYQLQQKDKEISLLKQRIANLRKNNEQLLSQVSAKKGIQANKSNRKSVQLQFQSDESQNQSPPQSRVKAMKTEPESCFVTETKSNNKRVEIGSGSNFALKWSDEAFNSKIKQIQVVLSEDGGIKDLHARYEKGETKRYDSFPKLKSAILTCSQHEYIKSLSGTFQDGKLAFLSLTTNTKRNQQMGKEKTEGKKSQSLSFVFQADEGEYIGALYGQKSEQGITKLGCMTLKE